MFKSTRIGRVAGIDLYIHPTFWLLVAYAFFKGGEVAALFFAAIFGCIVLHELGHALTARLYGIPTRDITLYPIGGVARLERMPRSPGAELVITIAGPLTNVLIAGVLWCCMRLGSQSNPEWPTSGAGQFVGELLWVNLLLAAFNLIPAFPMDGGRILRASLAGWLGRLRATEVAASMGQTLAVLLPVYLMFSGALQPLHVILAIFVFMAAGAELTNVRAQEAIRRQAAGGFPSGPAGDFSGATKLSEAPPGFRWVHRGNGVWQLMPIVLIPETHSVDTAGPHW